MQQAELSIQFCEKCGQGHAGTYGSGRFCSQACCRSFASRTITRAQRISARATRESRRPEKKLSVTPKNVNDREWYAKLDEQKKQRKHRLAKERKARIKNFTRQYLESHPCVDCGEKDIVVLEFDHVGDDKILDICTMVRHGWSIEAISEEISKCEVCCANCHRRRTHKRRIQAVG
jgi:hypothetical protein